MELAVQRPDEAGGHHNAIVEYRQTGGFAAGRLPVILRALAHFLAFDPNAQGHAVLCQLREQ